MKLQDYFKGWLVGDFEPALFKSKDIEIGIKHYKSGDIESNHHHKLTKEYTIVIFGVIKMLDSIYYANDIIIVNPNVKNKFECLEDACVLVIKTPSIIGDKFTDEDNIT
jgi:hypothetical protein